MRCPKCKYEPTDYERKKSADQCPDCGVFYQKFIDELKAKLNRGPATPVINPDKSTAKTFGAKVSKILRMPIGEATVKPGSDKGPFGHPLYKGEMYCTTCGSVGGSRRHVPGSILIEILLWICFFIPGVIYSIWRHSSSKNACRVCHMTTQIPAQSPLAQKMINE